MTMIDFLDLFLFLCIVFNAGNVDKNDDHDVDERCVAEHLWLGRALSDAALS